MINRNFELKIGKGTEKFSIPEAQLLYELVGENQSPPKDLAAAYRYALDHPIDSPPLREIVNPCETVAIAVSDITRVWQHNELTLPILIDYLNESGIEDKDILYGGPWKRPWPLHMRNAAAIPRELR